MQPARIRKLAKTASDLVERNGSYEAAFTLRWIAYEGLMLRAAIKALWMRGANVKEAENIVTRLPPRDPTALLGSCCDFHIDVTNDRHPILKRIKDRVHFRNFLFHQLNVASKSQLQLLSDILGFTLANPKTAFGNIPVRIAGLSAPSRLGDPLADLRRSKRMPNVRKKSVAELFRYNSKDLQSLSAIPDLTEDEVLRLFMPVTQRVTPSVQRIGPMLSKEELHKRMEAWKLSLNKPKNDAA